MSWPGLDGDVPTVLVCTSTLLRDPGRLLPRRRAILRPDLCNAKHRHFRHRQRPCECGHASLALDPAKGLRV